MPHQDPHIAHRELVTAYLLALAGMPLALRADDTGGDPGAPVKMTFSIA
jgi:hypothetical protein